MAMLSKSQKNLLERATLQYAANVELAAGYLANRGIDLEAARSNALGVVVDPVPGHEHLAGRLAIPYLTNAGPVNMNFRCIKDHVCKELGCAKYKNLTGAGTNLYGVQYLDEAGDWIAVAEGEIDALSSNLAGVPCVGIGGAKKWQPHWTNIFEDFSRVYVWQEGDKAGGEFADHLVSQVGAIRIVLQSGEDVNSTYVKQGADALRKMIRK